jgi:integrase
MRFTRPSVSRLVLPPGKTEQIVFDESLPGFGIRIRAGGKRTWVAQYRVGRQQRRTTIGSVETVDLEDARRRAKEILAKVQLGGDPQTEKSESRSRAALTLGPVADSYLEAYAADRLKPKTLADTRRYLRVSWKPLHGLPIGKIDRKTVAAHLAEIAKQSGQVTANRARASLSAVFSWAMREGIAEANPVIGTNRAADEVSRDRVLSDDELAAVWKACSDDDYGRIVRLLILTGQRREEVGGVTGSEIDFARARWILPRERTKNGLPHEVPLSGAAIAILRAAPYSSSRDQLFGEGRGSFQGWSKAKTALDRRIRANGLSIMPWRLHDLRRTTATRMAELGILPHVVEAVLNHISGHRAGVAGVYNRALYSDEKRTALNTWAAFVSSIVQERLPAVSVAVAPDNVQSPETTPDLCAVGCG